jgi:superfamily II DNA or RNA helicase
LCATMATEIQVGVKVLLDGSRIARVIELATLFGQQYADVYVEPEGPIQRLPMEALQPVPDPVSVLVKPTAHPGVLEPAPLFIAHLAAYQMQALLTQQGVLSAANFRITPLPHQVLSVDFVLGQLKSRVLIADEVGLGKTIEAAMIVEELKLRNLANRFVVIVPAGLLHQWQDEFKQKFGETFVIYDRNMIDALRSIHGKQANLWEQNDQIITSLDFVKPQRIHANLSPRERERREENNQRIFQDLIDANWDVVIFDEAHKLSKHFDGTETARYKVGEALAKVAPVFLLLTATPHQGDAGRFLHLLNLIDPYAFNQIEDLQPSNVSSVVWRSHKRAAVDNHGKPLFTHRITDIYPVDRSGQKHALERQLYNEVTDYVSKNYNQAMGRGDRAFGFLMILFQRMVTSSTQAIYEALLKRYDKLRSIQKAFESGAELGNGDERASMTGNANADFDEESASDDDAQRVLEELIQVAGVLDYEGLLQELSLLERLIDLARRALRNHDAKMVALMNIIDEVTRREGPQTKFLVFTEFIATQQALKKMLEGLGYTVELIYGSMPLEERILSRQRFAGDSQFLVSTDAGGEGINLQFCHVMVNYDLPWNPSRLEQRIGRLDRIGQKHNVLVLNLLVEDTVEKRVRQVLESKLDIIRKQFGEDKLADILSTLQDEFHFDRLYMDAVRKRQAEALELEQVAEQMLQRARQILENDDLLLPQAQTQVDDYRQKLIEISPQRLQSLLSGYLNARGESLKEYARRPGVYYFDLPGPDGLRAHYADVVFDREWAVDDDGLEYLHLNHDLVQRLISELTQPGLVAVTSLRLRNGALPGYLETPGAPGLFAIYRLQMTDGAGHVCSELIPVFLDVDGVPTHRFARALMEVPADQVETVPLPSGGLIPESLWKKVEILAEELAADRFSESQLQQAQSLEAEQRKVEKYYRQQEEVVKQIAIVNIRLAKQRELLERRQADLKALDERRVLVPALDLVVMAYVSL